jgi:hypothetical protein
MCGAGIDTRTVSEAIAAELRVTDYTPVPIKLSHLMAQVPGLEFLSEITAEDERIRASLSAGNQIRRVIGRNHAVANLALSEIHVKRRSLNTSSDPSVQAERHAFIISSLKREEELMMLRKLFGQRRLILLDSLSRTISTGGI